MPYPLFQVLTPGLLTTIQDRGRPGLAAQGVPIGGALDTWAASVANLLVGNTPQEAVLELTLTGPALCALQDVTLALCGANLSPRIGDLPVPLWRTVTMRQGQTLRFGRRESGARAYLAVAGGLDAPLVLGSRSTLLRAGWGGLEGRALRAGDVLQGRRESAQTHANGRGLRAIDVPRCPGHVTLRVVLGPDDGLLTPKARAALLSGRFAVSPQSDRMGIRLEGPSLPLRASAPDMLPSQGVCGGCVQIAGGQALLLMADCGTTGGYPVACVVTQADLPQAAQCAPGTTVSFQSVSVGEAHEAWQARERFLRIVAGASGG